jgi:hypothetical protein
MAQGQARSSNQLVVPEASKALEQFKLEVANEIGVQWDPSGYQGHQSARDMGAIGGHMVRRMVQIAEQQLSGNQQG